MHLLSRKRERSLKQPVRDEVIAFDPVVHKGFCLSTAAADIWHQCDGASTLADATRAARRTSGMPVAAETALLTLDAFAREGLLKAAGKAPAHLG